MKFRPRGYVGTNHQTIGSDILAVLSVVGLPAQTLGPTLHKQLREIEPGGWYPIELMLETLEVLDAKVGPNGLRQMGRRLFETTHQAHVRANLHSVHEVLSGFDGIYKRANRGEGIGGWSLLSFTPGIAKLEKLTPHHCALEEGITLGATNAFDVPASVSQERCLRRGADSCVFVVTSVVTDHRWR